MYRAELSGIAGTSMEPYMRQRHHKVSKVWVVPTQSSGLVAQSCNHLAGGQGYGMVREV